MMRQTEFPKINVPARELSTPLIGDLLQQYMQACEGKLKEFRLHSLVSMKPDVEASKQAAHRLRNIPDPELQRLIADTTRDVFPYVHWKQAREIYDVHPSMTRSFASMSSKTVIPGSVLRRLRHPNPLFITTAGTPVTHIDGHPGRILGFFITGGFSNGYPPADPKESRVIKDWSGTAAARRAAVLLDTHDPHANVLHAVIASEVLSADRSQVLDLDMCHITLPMTAEFSLDGLVKEIAEDGFRWAQGMRKPQEGELDEYLSVMARVVLTHLLYACSRTSEISEGKNDRPPVQRKKDSKGLPVQKPAKVHQMGYRTGAKIENNMRQLREQRAAGVPTGMKQPPHIRAAHPHLYRVGPGRAEVEIKFLDPIPVNMKDHDGVTATIHPMGSDQ